MMAQKSHLQEAPVSSRYLTFSLEPDLHDSPTFRLRFEQKEFRWTRAALAGIIIAKTPSCGDNWDRRRGGFCRWAPPCRVWLMRMFLGGGK
jgi:hypothetical protein